MRKVYHIWVWDNIHSWCLENILYNVHESSLHVSEESELKLLRLNCKMTSDLATIFSVLFWQICLGLWWDLILKSLAFDLEKMNVHMDLVWWVLSVVDFQLCWQLLVVENPELFVNESKSKYNTNQSQNWANQRAILVLLCYALEDVNFS